MSHHLLLLPMVGIPAALLLALLLALASWDQPPVSRFQPSCQCVSLF